MAKSKLSELKQRAKTAREESIKLENVARAAKDDARKAAEKRVAVEAELDLELWVEAQKSLGVDESRINRETRTVADLPEGPTYDERPGA